MDQTRHNQIQAQIRLFYPEARWITIYHLGLNGYPTYSPTKISEKLDIPLPEVKRVCHLLSNEARVEMHLVDMSEQEEELICRRYGFRAFRSHTYIQIANAMNMSEQEVSIMHYKILQRIKASEKDSLEGLHESKYLDQRWA